MGARDENLRASRFDAVFSGTEFRPENTKMAKQFCRPDQIEMPLRPFKIGLSGFCVCLAVSLAESVKKGCVGATSWATF